KPPSRPRATSRWPWKPNRESDAWRTSMKLASGETVTPATVTSPERPAAHRYGITVTCQLGGAPSAAHAAPPPPSPPTPPRPSRRPDREHQQDLQSDPCPGHVTPRPRSHRSAHRRRSSTLLCPTMPVTVPSPFRTCCAPDP